MKGWFPWLHRKDYTAELDAATGELEVATEQLRKSQEGLREAKLEQQDAHQLARTLQHIRAKNHFGEHIERAYRDNNHA